MQEDSKKRKRTRRTTESIVSSTVEQEINKRIKLIREEMESKPKQDILGECLKSTLFDDDMGEGKKSEVINDLDRNCPPPSYSASVTRHIIPSARSYLECNNNIPPTTQMQVITIDDDEGKEIEPATSFYNTFANVSMSTTMVPHTTSRAREGAASYSMGGDNPSSTSTNPSNGPSSNKSVVANFLTSFASSNPYLNKDLFKYNTYNMPSNEKPGSKIINELSQKQKEKFEKVFTCLKMTETGKHLKRCECCYYFFSESEMEEVKPEFKIFFRMVDEIDDTVKDPSHTRCYCCFLKKCKEDAFLDLD